MRTLSRCPACESPQITATHLATNVSATDARKFETGVVADAQYAVCRRCDLIFARRRQDDSDAEAYYRAFKVIEKRDYAVYPLPSVYLERQREFSDWLLKQIANAGVLKDCQNVLNVRCENGIHLANLRDQYGIQGLYGLDHFDSNIRYARHDLGLAKVVRLHPVKIENRFDCPQFDLILANHQLTHALDPLGLIRKLRSWLTPNGRLVLYNENDHLRLLRRKRIYHEGVGNYHKQLLTPRSLTNLCRLGGLRPLRVTHRSAAIKWACPRDTMLLVAERSMAVTPESLPRVIGSASRRSMVVGRAAYMAYRTGKQLERIYRRRAA